MSKFAMALLSLFCFALFVFLLITKPAYGLPTFVEKNHFILAGISLALAIGVLLLYYHKGAKK